MLDLKDCPFCGGKASIRNGVPGCSFVQCATCNATSDVHSEETAIAAWNRRALQAVGPEPAVAVKALVEQIDALLAFENPAPPIPNLARTLLASARSALVATPPAALSTKPAVKDDETVVEARKRLERAGGAMSNILYNLKQDPTFAEALRDRIAECQEEWDAALAAKDGRS